MYAKYQNINYKRSLSTKKIITTLNSWGIDVSKSNFKEKAKSNFSCLDLGFSLLEGIDDEHYHSYYQDNTLEFTSILWDRLAKDVINLSKVSTLINEGNEDVNDPNIEILLKAWKLIKKKFDQQTIEPVKIAEYLTSEYPFEGYFFGLISSLRMSLNNNEISFQIVSKYIDEWKHYFSPFRNNPELVGIIEFYLNGEISLYYHYTTIEKADAKYQENLKLLPNAYSFYLTRFEYIFNHIKEVSNADFKDLELSLLTAKDLMDKYADETDVQFYLLEKFEELYEKWGNSNKLDKVRNELESLKISMDKENEEADDNEKGENFENDDEKYLSTYNDTINNTLHYDNDEICHDDCDLVSPLELFTKNLLDNPEFIEALNTMEETNWDPFLGISNLLSENLGYMFLQFVCYNCKITYREKITKIYIDVSFIDDLTKAKLTTVDNGKVSVPYEIQCPNCSSSYFKLGYSALTIILDYYLKYAKSLEPKNKSSIFRFLNKNNNETYYDNSTGIITFHRFKYTLDLNIKSHAGALKDIKRRYQKNPSDPNILLKYGNILRKYNLYTKAKKYYLKLIKIDPKNSEAYFNLGEIYLNRDDEKKARYCFRKMNKIKPKYWKKMKRNYVVEEKTILFIEDVLVNNKGKLQKIEN